MGAADTSVAGYSSAWRPCLASPEAAAFARVVVAAAGPHGRQRAKNLLWAAGRLASYGIGLGLEPVPEVLLHPVSHRAVHRARAGGCPGRPAAPCARTCGSWPGRLSRSWRRRTRRCPASGPGPRIPRPRSAATSPSPAPSPPRRGRCARPG